MPKHKFNLVGNTFNYENAPKCSVWGKTSKFTEWVDEGGDGTFYVDSAIGLAFDDPRPGPKYAWILESAAILPQITDFVKGGGRERTIDTFDIIFTHNQELIDIDPEKFKWVPAQGTWIKEPKIYDKSKMISMIASNKNMCAGHRKRLEWIERLKDQVDFLVEDFPLKSHLKKKDCVTTCSPLQSRTHHTKLISLKKFLIVLQLELFLFTMVLRILEMYSIKMVSST